MSLDSLKIIARARNGFAEKFGIPRQSREGSVLLTRIVFEPDYRVREALRGIEDFSHLWLLWGFSANKTCAGSSVSGVSRVSSVSSVSGVSDAPGKESEPDWSPTVRPPRLGGNTRMGVFATRSPYRPNPIGLTSVRLLGIEETAEGAVLIVSGADLLDGTPIYDIKPYISFSDSHPDALNGFAEAPKDYRLPVEWGATGASAEDAQAGAIPSAVKAAFEEILSQDPRPAYQNDPERLYGLQYGGWEVKFKVVDGVVRVEKVMKK